RQTPRKNRRSGPGWVADMDGGSGGISGSLSDAPILAGMQAILAITVPFFALVLLGWLAARAGPLPESAIPGLNAYVLFFALPCMLFRFGASLPIARLADPVLLGIYLVAALAMVALAIVATLRTRRRPGGVGLRDAA